MEKLPQFSKELESAVLTVMRYFIGTDDSGAFFIQLLISPDLPAENAAVEDLYRVTLREFGDNKNAATEVIKAFKVIRKCAIHDPEVRKELEKQVQLLAEISVAREIFGKK